ncbi:MAG: hypothetical protein LBM17_06300 [Candidatus Accumulibacter sp.]|jgi:hypothetical protein|nr:hypothetical protein [Accumulibacter sp.]
MKPVLPLMIFSVLVLGGCASTPSGPRVTVLPGTGKSFSEFLDSDRACRQHAQRVIGQASDDPAVRDAVVGTAVGALAGAAIGGRGGAGVGAGMGLVVGSAAGSESSRLYGHEAQYRYDEAYMQCMYSAGHKIPVPAEMARSMAQTPLPALPVDAAGVGGARVAEDADIPPPPPFQPPLSPPPDYVAPR